MRIKDEPARLSVEFSAEEFTEALYQYALAKGMSLPSPLKKKAWCSHLTTEEAQLVIYYTQPFTGGEVPEPKR